MDISILILLLLIASESTYLVLNSSEKILKKRNYNPTFVDTSALIDGRIVSVARTGFLKGKVYIPRSVVGELQLLADNSDSEKRSRARHGLDIVSELQTIPDFDLDIFQDSENASEGVDNRLLKLAKQYRGSICTIDYNLNKVARVEGIQVLNVNDLAMSLRMAYLPGEKMQIELISKGSESHQAVGHLADGTMVVVENSSAKIGQTVEVEFIRSLQTAAGKMMFARLISDKKVSKQPTKPMRAKQPSQPRKAQQPQQPSQNQQVQKVHKYNQRNNNYRRNSFKNRAEQSESNLVDLANRK